MKKNFASVMLLLSAVSLFLIGCEKETVLKESDFPLEIQTYVETYFPDHDIVQVVRDQDDFKDTYDVILSGAISLGFDRDYKILELSSMSGLPDKVIPEDILVYVHANYPQQFIVEWDLDRKSQHIDLDNGLELHFSKEGEFLRIDDD